MTSSKIDISVLIPIYGVEAYVENSLRSIFTQSKTDNVEFILVNDCTRDRSMEIVNKLILEFPELLIRIIEHKTNKGIGAVRKSALDAAQGEYIMFLDSDDLCDKEMLASLHLTAVENDADMVCCDFVRLEGDKRIVIQEPVTGDGFECARKMLMNRMYGMVWNKLIKRDLFTKNDINSVEGINLGEDLIICLKLLCYAKKIVYLPKVFYTYIYRTQSITSQFHVDKLGDIEAYLQDIEQFFRTRGFYKEIEGALMWKKVIEKCSLMKNSKGKRRRNFAKLYPEATPYIMECDSLPHYLRKALMAATRGNMLSFNSIMLYREIRGVIKSKK